MQIRVDTLIRSRIQSEFKEDIIYSSLILATNE